MGRPEDDLWKYVERIGAKWQCSFCLEEYSGGASRIRAHLSCKKGQGIAACPNVPAGVKLEASRRDGTNIASTRNPQGGENEMPFTEQDLAPEDLVNRYSNTAFESLDKLLKEVNYLKCQADDVEEQVNWLESQKEKKRKRQVAYWLHEVDSINKRVEDIAKSMDQSDMLKRIEMEEQIKQLFDGVEKLKKLKPCEGSLTLDVPVTICTQQPLPMTGKMVGQKFQRNIDKIWELLNDENVKIIGVRGMGGAGKTTLISCIHNEILKRVNIFGSVFWVTVSQDFSIYKLQHDIAKRINFTLGEENDERIRAARLRKALVEKKQSVLILDVFWNKIDLNKVGIPIEEGGIKLILTTRSLQVCHRTGCASNDHIIMVEPLSDEEAWQLFLQHLGIHEKSPTLDPEILKIARCVARECNGLPLGIKVLATIMKGVEDIHQWRHALTELQDSTLREQDIEEEVFKVLRFNYDRLHDTKMQNCFLYCSLYPEDFEIACNELIENFVHEGLISGGKMLEEIYDEGQIILDKLVGYSLLEDCEVDGIRCVKMHDLLRDMACRMEGYMVKSGRRLTKIPHFTEWTTDLEKVSLMCNLMRKIPEGMSPRCPLLSTLILSYNPLPLVPDCFLVQMPALTTLDLSFTEIQILPNSISDLKSLLSLLLRDCMQLKYVIPLGNLQALSTLVISGTAIKQAPQGLEALVNLKWLDLSCNDYLESQPGSILSNLISLQFLSVDLPSFRLQAEDFERLSDLECFIGIFDGTPPFNDFVRRILDKCCGPKHYTLISALDSRSDLGYFGRHVVLEHIRDKLEYILPRGIEELTVGNSYIWNGCLCSNLSLDGVSPLRVCHASRYCGSSSLFCLSRSCSFCNNVQNLQQLYLDEFYAPVLWKENKQDDIAKCLTTSAVGKFSCLTYLSISQCYNMKKLLTVGMLVHLQNLVRIDVKLCPIMEEIFSDQESNEESSRSQDNDFDANDTQVILLPKLQELRLKYLPQLKRVCVGIMACDSFQKLFIQDCSKLEGLPRIQSHSQIQVWGFPSL